MLHTLHILLLLLTVFVKFINNYACKGKSGRGRKITAKPQAFIPPTSSDDVLDHDDHVEHDNSTPDVSTPPKSKKSKKMRQLTAEEEDDMAEWVRDHPYIYNNKLD